MKKLVKIPVLLSLLMILSCGDDESESPAVGVNGTITYDGQTYAIASGVINQRTNAAGAELEFLIADGTVTSTGSSSDSQIIVSIRAISEGTESLENGSYEVSRQVTSQYAFVTVSTASASNVRSIVGGTITISGSGSTYSLTFNNVAFGNGIELTGSVSGTFES